MRWCAAVLGVVLAVCLPVLAWADDPLLVVDPGGHLALIRDIMFSSDGQFLVSAGDDKVVRVWDVKTGETVRTIRGQVGDGHEGKIYAAALSAQDKYLAVGGWFDKGNATTPCCGTIRLHDFRSGEVVGILPGHTSAVFALAFSADGRWLASGGADNTVRLWDVAGRKALHVLTGHSNAVFAVAFSPDAKRLGSGSNDHTLRLWDVQPGTLLKEMKDHTDDVVSAAFSPDGRYLASGSDDKTVRLWDARTGAAVKVLARQGTNVSSLSFSPDSRWLLTGSGTGGSNVCNIFAVPSGEVISHFDQHANVVLATAIAPDGQVVATGGGSTQEIALWNPQTGKVIRTLVGKGHPVWSVGFARDGRSIAFGNTFDRKSDNNRGPLQHTLLLRQDSDEPVSLAREVSNAADYLRAVEQVGTDALRTRQGGSYGYQAILQILQAGKVQHEIQRDASSGFSHRAYTFTHDGRAVISGGSAGVLALYDRDTGKQVRDFVGHTGDVWAVAVAPDNRTLVSGANDQTIKLWDIATGHNLLTIFVGADQEWVAWTPQGYYTASPKGDSYIGWHRNQGQDKAAQYYTAAQFQSQFYRPDVVAAYLQSRDIQLAVRRANAARGGSTRQQPVLTAADVTTFLPPQIVIITPYPAESTVQQATLAVKAEAVSQTLPISDVEVHLNGIQIAGGARGKSRGEPMRRQVEMDVTLEPGINTLTFIAKHDKASSAPVFRRIVYAAPRKEERPALRLLSIGISRYQDPSLHLDFARQDAIAIANAFATQEGRLFHKVHSKQLLDQDATRAAILRALNWLKEGEQRDYRLVFLAGHGGMDRQQHYYFFAHDHDPAHDLEISNIKWTSILDRLTATPSKAILLVDTCRAAAIAGDGKTRGTVNFDQILRDMQSDYRGVVTFAASTGKQVSREKPEWGHGAFTKAVLEGLVEGKADGYGGQPNGTIETKELGAWIIDRVKVLTDREQDATHTQPPELPSFPLYQVK